MPRLIKDAGKSATANFANAGAASNTNSIDLENVVPYPVQESVGAWIQTNAAVGANNKNINITIQDSADNSNWANVGDLGVFKVVDNNNQGYPAANFNIALPPGIRRYIRAAAATEAAGGATTNSNTFTLRLAF